MPMPPVKVTLWRRDRPWEVGCWECPKVEVAGHEGWAWPGALWSEAEPELLSLMCSERTMLALGNEPMRVTTVLMLCVEPSDPVTALVEVAPWPG